MHIEESSPFGPGRLDRHMHLIEKLADLFVVMDQRYQAAAEQYGFVCTGCEESCCYTRFFHHTVVEYGFLCKGFTALDPDRQNALRQRADQYIQTLQRLDAEPANQRPMCPLNENSRCILYAYRPMICRLHGLPHEIRKPGSGATSGPGCHVFEAQFGAHDYIAFDRTPLYRQMAVLEMELRQALNLKSIIKMTIAEMIATF